MPTKLGPHVLRAAPDVLEYIHAGVPVVKFVGDWGMAEDVPEGALIVGRQYRRSYDAQLQKNTGKTPREAARQYVSDQLPRYRSNPRIVYWEGHNEPVWTTLDEMAWYAQFEIERMKLMAQLGLKCVIGNFASGTPPLDMWPAFLSAVRAALDYEGVLGLHEYSCPWLWWMTGKYQLNPEEDQGDEGWTTLRYRKVYRKYLIPEGIGRVPLVLTECGIDPLVNPKPDGAPSSAWKQLGNYWREHNNEPDKADFYFRQLVWYDQELQKDDYVVGGVIFTWGNTGHPWSDFDVAGTDVSRKLVEYAASNPATQPFVYPGQQKLRGQPRVQYERTYVLLPPNADAAWARAVVRASWDDYRYTVGGSADDAGIGDLDVRRIIAVNPDAWAGSQSLQEFFKTHYGGAEYRAVTAETPEELLVILSLQ